MDYEIRAIIGKDGETYLNARDIAIVMQKLSIDGGAPSLSALNFVRIFIVNLITARSE